MSEPIRMPANQPADRFYRGGSRIRNFRGTADAGDRVPEDWVGSMTPLFGEQTIGLTTIDGALLRDVVSADPVGWLGPDHVRRWGSNPALLVKLLDAEERLPVHLHPDRNFARAHLDSPFGKTEAWIALEPVTAWVGFSRPVSEGEIALWVAEQDTAAMLASLNQVAIPRGSSIVIPAGVPHSLGEGAFVVELQEPTDFTVLMEWRGFDIDGAAAGHLGLGFDVALKSLDRSAWSTERVGSLVAGPGALSSAADGYFRAEFHHNGDTLDPGFSVLVVSRGVGTLSGHPVSKGDTWVIPFSAGPLMLEGDVDAVRCRPPA
jgi:mannose-6-phosphate isomerase